MTITKSLGICPRCAYSEYKELRADGWAEWRGGFLAGFTTMAVFAGGDRGGAGGSVRLVTNNAPTIREQLLAARAHASAASGALNQITTKLRRAGDMDHEDDAWNGVLLLADVISAIDLLLMTEIGS